MAEAWQGEVSNTPRCPEAKPTDEVGIAKPRRMRRVFSNTSEPCLGHWHCYSEKNKYFYTLSEKREFYTIVSVGWHWSMSPLGTIVKSLLLSSRGVTLINVTPRDNSKIFSIVPRGNIDQCYPTRTIVKVILLLSRWGRSLNNQPSRTL